MGHDAGFGWILNNLKMFPNYFFFFFKLGSVFGQAYLPTDSLTWKHSSILGMHVVFQSSAVSSPGDREGLLICLLAKQTPRVRLEWALLMGLVSR